MRRLGRTDLSHRADRARRQRVRLDGRQGGVLRRARPVRRSRPRRDRHRRHLFRLGAGQPRRRIRDDHRRMDEGAGKPEPRDRHHQGRLADGEGQGGPEARLYRGGGRGVAEAASDRRRRPLPLALARHGDAGRRDARRLPAPDREGQDPLVRRLQPQPDAARTGGLGGEGAAAPATRSCSRNTISPTAPASRAVSPSSAGARRSASSPITAWRKGFCRANTAARRTWPRARAATP